LSRIESLTRFLTRFPGSYDVSDEEDIVYVRAVRKKPPGRKTEDIL